MQSVLMQLYPIDKSIYNKRIKIFFFAICLFMITISLLVSTLLIHFFSFGEGNNFWLNVAGILVAASAFAAVYRHYKTHPFLKDIVFVRALKAQLNYIYRKQQPLLKATQAGDPTAMAVLDFSYNTAKFVYELDNNTLTLEELNKAHNELKALAEKYQVTEFETYSRDLLKNY
jgi:hypothetical protein